jgi:hypothetical protein
VDGSGFCVTFDARVGAADEAFSLREPAAFGFGVLGFAFFARAGRDGRASFLEFFCEPLLDRVAMVLRAKVESARNVINPLQTGKHA